MKYGWEGYGLYWAMLEAMYETADAKLDAKLLRALCIRFSVTEDHLEEFVGHCVESGLFSRDEEHLYSPRLAEEKLLAIERSKTARQSAERRWKNHKPKPTNANAVQPQSVGNAPPTHHKPTKGSAAKAKKGRTNVHHAKTSNSVSNGACSNTHGATRRTLTRLGRRAAAWTIEESSSEKSA